ncbi:MmgE/PrpD family protein [Streptomyces chartreusis]|uniref:MmgE/PrpD family protein n=1 Tax=Streptomyces chartreusis TaxID=1969 RepID=UPI0036BB6E08
MSFIAEAGRFISELSLNDVPEATVDRARLQCLSMMAASLAAHSDPVASAAAKRIAQRGSIGESTILGLECKRNAIDAVAANSILSMSLDYDDYCFMGHTGHSSVLASLAMAEHTNATVSEFLCSVIAANEIGGRLGAATFFGPQNGQMWTHIHLAGAAAASARLIGLNAHQTADALALALAQPPSVLQAGFFGADSKVLAASAPSSSGMYAAELAADGLRGELGIVEGRRGVLSTLAWWPLEGLLTGLGEVWLTDTLAYKVYPGCAYIDSAVDGLLSITGGAAQHNPPVHDISVRATGLTWGMERYSRRWASPHLTPIGINFSVQKSLAVAWVAGELSPAQLTPEWLSSHEDLLHKAQSQIRLIHDLRLTGKLVKEYSWILRAGKLTARRFMLNAQRLRGLTFPFSAIVHACGETQRVALPLGSPGRPWSETEELMIAKLAGQTSRPAAESVMSALNRPNGRVRDLVMALGR